jgi:rubrerythrin
MSTEASIRADAAQADAEDRYGYAVEYGCQDCKVSWSVWTYEGEGDEECPVCGEGGEPI